MTSTLTPTRPATNGETRKEVRISLPVPAITSFRLKLRGTTPLITNAFGAAAKAAMAHGQSGAAKQKKAPRNPQADFENGCYVLPDGGYGIPKLAFRKAIQAAAVRMTDVKGTEALAAFQIDTPDELLPLELEGPPRMRTDHVVHGMTADLAYRPEFWPWAVTLPVRLDHEVLSLTQFTHLVFKAGLGVGVGNWRAEKKGDFGAWTIAGIEDVFVTEKEGSL